ncbi:hypothetical protein [Bacillus velezensis]|uniref:hypothetical protein n=1 Tax=Bacillus velezensis TaxID=492670 RepID=UPI00140A051C|nr:hypothetical protein [Bacillus velezensis]
MEMNKNDRLSTGFKETNPPSGKYNDKKPQKLTESDLRNLMGINRPTYKRGRGGAFRQQ